MSLMITLQPNAGPALVVGGGAVAARKVKSLVEAGFRVRVIAPDVSEAIRAAAGVELWERPWRREDIDAERFGVALACTDQRQVNREVGEAAREKQIPVLVADSPEESTFFMPAVLRDGELLIGVSTGGASPTIARQIRERVAAAAGSGWREALSAAREERNKRRGAGNPQ